jgi:hypothetical protein
MISVAEQIQKMKKGLADLKLPDTFVVQPLTSYRNTNVLRANEKYYDIGNYEVIRENGEMKIIGIRFFTRLF